MPAKGGMSSPAIVAGPVIDELKIAGWGPAPADLRLADNEVHVWRGTVKASASELREILPTLPRSERKQAARHPQTRNFAAARHMLRFLLGGYLRREPERLKLADDASGHLRLSRVSDAPPWDFAWGGNRALFAISSGQRLGLHLEVVPGDLDVSGMMDDVPPREARLIEFYAPQNRARAVVGYRAERCALERLATQAERSEPPGARVERLRLGKRFVAALAAEGWDWTPSFWQYGAERSDSSDPED